jgi:hypothetical protein
MQIDKRLNCLLPQYRVSQGKKVSLCLSSRERGNKFGPALEYAIKIALLAAPSVAYAIQGMSRVVDCTIFLLHSRGCIARDRRRPQKCVCIQSIAPLSALSLFYEHTRILHSKRGENPPRSCAASSVLYIYYCMYSLRGGSHEIVYYKKNERPFVELGR